MEKWYLTSLSVINLFSWNFKIAYEFREFIIRKKNASGLPWAIQVPIFLWLYCKVGLRYYGFETQHESLWKTDGSIFKI